MKHGVQWYLQSRDPGVLARAAAAVQDEGVKLEQPSSGRILRLSDEPGHEGEQVGTTRERLADEQLPVTLQVWVDDSTDVTCQVDEVPDWSCLLLSFDFDGLTPDEARRVTMALFRAQQALEETVLWLADRVGLGSEHGPAHTWNGAHAPAYPPTWRAG